MNKIIIYALLVLLTLTICSRPLQCKPLDIKNTANDDLVASPNETNSDNDDEYYGNLDEKTKEQLRKCDEDLETMELCMRCAKVTKSTIVYPLCCANEDSIKQWCHDYVFFGA